MFRRLVMTLEGATRAEEGLSAIHEDIGSPYRSEFRESNPVSVPY